MFRSIQETFIPARIIDEEERSNIRLIVSIVITALIVSIAGFAVLGVPLQRTNIMAAMAVIALGSLSSLIAIKLDKLQFARVATPLAAMAGIIGLLATSLTGVHDLVGIAMAVVIMIATITLGRPGTIIFSLLSITAMSTIAILEINGVIVNEASAATVYKDVVVIVLVGLALMSVMNGFVSRLNDSFLKVSETARKQAEINQELRALQSTLEERTTELDTSNRRNESRARQFEAVARMARSISSTQNFDILLPQIANMISGEFGFYHVGIFLVDLRKEYAVLSASNSEGGQRMLERNHRLKVGETGIVGYVTSAGKARVALDIGADNVFFNNPDLPETRSEITLPLRVGDEIIGALDVQSNQPDAFHEEDVNILSALADQVSIAIQNARQYDVTRKALAESNSLSRQFVQTGWQDFTKRQNLAGVRHTGAKATLLYAKNKKGEDAGSSNREQTRARARGVSLSLPLKLRGEVIGSVDIRSQANRQFDQDELDIVTAIIERAAIALENARLLEDAQRRASKEQAISELSANISSASEVEKILQTTVEELGRRLSGTSGITIEMKDISGKSISTRDKEKRNRS